MLVSFFFFFIFFFFLFVFFPVAPRAATAPPTLSPFDDGFASYQAYTRVGPDLVIGSLSGSTNNFSINFYNDYNSAGTLSVHIPEASSSASVLIKDLDTGLLISSFNPMHLDYKSARGKEVVTYLKLDQKVNIYINDPDVDISGHYPVFIDYYSDSKEYISDMDWLTAAISRVFRRSHENSIAGYVRDMNGLSDQVSHVIYGLGVTDAVISLGSSALSPMKDPNNSKKIIGYVVDPLKKVTTSDLFSTANVLQKAYVTASSEENVSLGWENTSDIYDGVNALGQLYAGNPIEAYQTIVMDFAKASVYMWGVFGLSDIEKGINAHYLVKYLMAEHRNQNSSIKFSESYVRYITQEWADYTESECGFFEDKRGCGLDNYDPDAVWYLYSNMWDLMQSWILKRKVESNWYADVDGDGWENSYEVANGYDPNDRNSPPPPDFSLGVTSPTYNMTFEPGDSVTVKWIASEDLSSSQLKIELILASGAPLLLASGVSTSTEQHVVSLPSSLSPYSSYKIRLTTTSVATVTAESQGFTVESGAVPDPSGSAPNAYGTEPEFQNINNIRGDTTLRFKVRGTDIDGNLDYVLWRSSDAFLSESARPTASSNNVIITDSSDNMDGSDDTASSYIQIKASSDKRDVYVYACVYDTEGNMDSYYWKVGVEPTFAPVLSPKVPAILDTGYPLGSHKFEFYVSDADNNLDRYEVYIDDTKIFEESITGGDPQREERFAQYISLLEKKDTKVEVVCYDEDGLSGRLAWIIHAGLVEGNANTPVIYEYGLDDDVDYQICRLNRGYVLKAKASDADLNLVRMAIYLNDQPIAEDIDNSPDGSGSITAYFHFVKEGSNKITFYAEDAGGELCVREMIFDVLPDDGSGSIHCPELLEVYPAENFLYGSRISIQGRAVDIDGDLYFAKLKINNVTVGSADLRNNVDFKITFDPPSGSNSLELWLEDRAGNIVKTKTWTVSQTGGTSVAPNFKIIGEGQVLHVKAGQKARINIYAWDASGDLDKVDFDWSGVGAPLYDGYLNGYFYSQDDTEVPINSGRVWVSVTDDVGNISKKYIDIVVDLDVGNNPPSIYSSSVYDGALIRMYSPSWSWTMDAVAFDPDGDISSLSLIKNGIEVQSRSSGDYIIGDHIYNGGGDFYYDYLPRKDVGDYILRATDSRGNKSEIKFRVLGGPNGPTNHSPQVPDTINITMDQDTIKDFTVPLVDEEGDVPFVRALNLSAGDSFEQVVGGELRYIPADGFYGERSFTLNFDDGYGGVANSTVNITINQVIYPPRLTQYSHDVYLDSPSFDLGSYLRPMVINDACSLDEIVISNLQLTLCEATGTTLGFTDSLMVTPVNYSSLATVIGVLEDPDGRTSQPFTVNMRFMDTDNDGITDIMDDDDDNDQMPDEWEIQFGLNPFMDDAEDDADADGLTNISEYKGGTDPKRPNFLISPVLKLLLD